MIPRTSLRAKGVYGVQYLDQIDGTKAVFVCQHGHRMTHDYGKGPISKRMPASALQRFAKYWGLKDAAGVRHGHVYGYCKRCAALLGEIADRSRGRVTEED